MLVERGTQKPNRWFGVSDWIAQMLERVRAGNTPQSMQFLDPVLLAVARKDELVGGSGAGRRAELWHQCSVQFPLISQMD